MINDCSAVLLYERAVQMQALTNERVGVIDELVVFEHYQHNCFTFHADRYFIPDVYLPRIYTSF
jgi:hypothetical protein